MASAHIHIIGKSFTDTTDLIQSLALERANRGMLFIDTQGDPSLSLIDLVPIQRHKDIVFYDATDFERPIPINILGNVPADLKPMVTDAVLEMFLSVWQYGDFPATLVIDCLYNSIAALLDYPDGTLLGIKYLMISEKYRNEVIPHIKNPVVRDYWQHEFSKLSLKERNELTRATRTNIHQLVADPRICNIIGTTTKPLSFADIIAKKKIVIARIPQRHFGKRKLKLLGTLLLASTYFAVQTKTPTTPFSIFVVGCDRVDTPLLTDMIATVGEMNCSVTLQHLYLAQLSEQLHDAIMGLVPVRYCFRLGITDAELLEKTWKFDNSRTLLTELAPGAAQVLLTDTVPEERSFLTIPQERKDSMVTFVAQKSRELYGVKRRTLETQIEQTIRGT